MLTSSRRPKAQTWSFLDGGRDDLVILDWLPWSHTFGPTTISTWCCANGGSLYVDGGKPAPGCSRSRSQSAQRDADGLFQRARGFDMLNRGAAQRKRGAAPAFFQRA